jgi:hypothetical protein
VTVLEIVTLVGVLVAAIGYFAKYATDLRLAQRNDRLERINQQLIEFYGPLLACTQSSEESWHAFRKRHRPGIGSFWRSDPPPTREDVLVWRLWITTVFMPVNERITQLVFERADLIVEPEMPRCLLAVCAHVAGYRAIIKEWESGEVPLRREDNLSLVNFPGQELADYATTRFAHLKAEQGKLLGSRSAGFRDAGTT